MSYCSWLNRQSTTLDWSFVTLHSPPGFISLCKQLGKPSLISLAKQTIYIVAHLYIGIATQYTHQHCRASHLLSYFLDAQWVGGYDIDWNPLYNITVASINHWNSGLLKPCSSTEWINRHVLVIMDQPRGVVGHSTYCRISGAFLSVLVCRESLVFSLCWLSGTVCAVYNHVFTHYS